MTPFGLKIREIRSERKIALKTMAHALDVSPAYLSALEHGHRGKPSHHLVQKIIAYFNIIWDDAEELERLADVSHPRVVIDTAGLDPIATDLANTLASSIGKISRSDLEHLKKELDSTLTARKTSFDSK